MLMDVKIKEEALKDLESFEDPHKDWILNKIEELSDKPTEHEKCGIIRVRGKQVFKYVMKQGSKGGKDYRAIYDIENGRVEIKALFHRDEGYDKQIINQRL